MIYVSTSCYTSTLPLLSAILLIHQIRRQVITPNFANLRGRQYLGPWTYLRRSLRPYGFKPFTDEFLLLKNLNCIKSRHYCKQYDQSTSQTQTPKSLSGYTPHAWKFWNIYIIYVHWQSAAIYMYSHRTPSGTFSASSSLRVKHDAYMYMYV